MHLMEIGSIATSQDLEAAYARGRLRLERTSLDEATADEEIVGFADSMAEYDLVTAERATAVTRLLDVTETPEWLRQQARAIPQRWKSWHHKVNTTDSGFVVSTAYEIILNTHCDDLVGHFDRRPGVSERDRLIGHPVTIRAHVIHPLTDGYSGQESRHMTGHLVGNVIFDSDTITSALSEFDTKRVPKATLVSQIRTELTAAGIADVMAGHVDSYLEAVSQDTQGDPPSMVGIPGSQYLGLDFDNHIRILLMDVTNDPDDGLAKLKYAFGSGYTNSIHTLLSVPIHALTRELNEVKAMNRYIWLTNNLTLMRTQLRDTIRAKVVHDFANAFEARLVIERAKTKEIRDLAFSLESDATCINNCRPSSKQMLSTD